MRKFLGSLLEVVEIVAVAVIAVWGVRTFLVQPFLVSGESMVPTFQNGDYLLIDELTYRFRAAERGEVIVFRYPEDDTTYFIKRVIGLPGERVKIEDGAVTIYNAMNREGFRLTEDYLALGAKTDGMIDLQLGADEYYMLGDNRPYSFDSRRWGALPEEDIVGRVLVRLWPASQAAVIKTPDFGPEGG